jgi:hypothetical protein
MRRSRKPGRGAGAFSLLEILVAVAVLLLIVVLMAQMLNSVSSTTSDSQKGVDAVGDAQLAFDRLSFDLARMIRREDVDYSFSKRAGNDRLSFYAAEPGFYTGPETSPRILSVAGYRVADGPDRSPRLERGALNLSWSGSGGGRTQVFSPVDEQGAPLQKFDTPNSLPVLDDGQPGDYQALADQVFRLEICYLTRDGVLTTNFPDRLADLSALVVAIGVLDPKSRKLVSDYTALISAFPDAENGSDLLALWGPVAADPGLAARAGVPRAAAQAVRVYQRTFPLR